MGDERADERIDALQSVGNVVTCDPGKTSEARKFRGSKRERGRNLSHPLS